MRFIVILFSLICWLLHCEGAVAVAAAALLSPPLAPAPNVRSVAVVRQSSSPPRRRLQVDTERCTTAYNDVFGLNECEPTYRRNVASSCELKDPVLVSDDSAFEGKLGTPPDNGFGFGLLKALARTMMHDGYIRPVMRIANATGDDFDPFYNKSVGEGVTEMFGWFWLAVLFFLLGIFVFILLLCYVCPVSCCRCARRCWCCCPAYPTEKKTSMSCFNRYFWSICVAVLLLFFSILSLVFTSKTVDDYYAMPCTTMNSVYETAFGTREQAANLNPAFLGMAAANKFIDDIQKELTFVTQFVTAWSGVVEYTTMQNGLFAPLSWTDFNLNGRPYQGWMDQTTGELGSVKLAHTLLANQAMLNSTYNMLDFNTVYKPIVTLGGVPEVTNAFDLDEATKTDINNGVAQLQDEIAQVETNANLPHIYQAMSNTFDAVLKGQQYVYDSSATDLGWDTTALFTFIEAWWYVFCSIPLLSVVLGIPAWWKAYKLAKKQAVSQESRRQRAEGSADSLMNEGSIRRPPAVDPKETLGENAVESLHNFEASFVLADQTDDGQFFTGAPSKGATCYVGFLNWWFLILAVLYLIFGGLVVAVVTAAGDPCGFFMDDLFKSNMYESYAYLSQNIPANLSNHCLWEGADGDILAAVAAEEQLAQVDEMVWEVSNYIIQQGSIVDTVPPADDVMITIPESTTDYVNGGEKSLYSKAILNFADPEITHLLIADSNVVWSGLDSSDVAVDSSTLIYRIMSDAFNAPIFPAADFPSISGFPWATPDGKPPTKIVGLSSFQSVLKNIWMNELECKKVDANPSFCVLADSSCKPNGNSMSVSFKTVSFLDASLWKTETALGSSWSTKLKAAFAGWDLEPMWECLDAGKNVERQVLFLNTVYIAILKELALSEVYSDVSEHSLDDHHYDLCPVGIRCPIFVGITGADAAHGGVNSTFIVRSYSSHVDGLTNDLNSIFGMTPNVTATLRVMTNMAAFTNLATRLQGSVHSALMNLNCRAAFEVVEAPIKRICTDLAGDLSVMIFSWAMLGVAHFCGFIVAYTHWYRMREIRDAPKIKRSESGFLRAALMADQDGVRDYTYIYHANSLFDDRYNSPLHYAAYKGSVQCCNILVSAGWDTNAKNVFGYTPLSVSAAEGHDEVVAVLLRAGAQANCRDEWGDTPLHAAARAGKAEVVATLVAGHAPLLATDNAGKTAAQVAEEFHHANIVEMLRKAEAEQEARFAEENPQGIQTQLIQNRSMSPSSGSGVVVMRASDSESAREMI